MRARRAVGLLLDIALLVAGVGNDGPVADQIRVLAVVLVAMVGALALFGAVVLAIGLAAQRQEPYPMESSWSN